MLLMPDVDRDLLAFALGIVLFVAYLFWSAATEMGTRSPKWLRDRQHRGMSDRENDRN